MLAKSNLTAIFTGSATVGRVQCPILIACHKFFSPPPQKFNKKPYKQRGTRGVFSSKMEKFGCDFQSKLLYC